MLRQPLWFWYFLTIQPLMPNSDESLNQQINPTTCAKTIACKVKNKRIHFIYLHNITTYFISYACTQHASINLPLFARYNSITPLQNKDHLKYSLGTLCTEIKKYKTIICREGFSTVSTH